MVTRRSIGLLSAAHAADARNLAVERVAAATNDAKVALVIGNSRYKSKPLDNPGNDARAIAAKLRELGFDVILRENLGAMQIGGALREFRTRLKPGAVALFFYAGHGLLVNGTNYLPAVDAEITSEEDVPHASLNVNDVLRVMDESKTRLNLVFLDACRDNPYARGFRSAAGGLGRIDAPSGTLISFATRPNSVAADAGSGRNGLYTEHLLAAMDLPGLAIEQMLKRVASGVKQASRGRQEPWIEGIIEGEFHFRPGPGTQVASIRPEPLRADPEDQAWQAAKEANGTAGFEAYLSEYPRGRYASTAKVKLATLREARVVSTQTAVAPAATMPLAAIPTPTNRPIPSPATWSVSVARPPLKKLPANGLSDSCADCHGVFGESSSPSMPALAGQPKSSLIEAMMDFKNGRRASTIMGRIAKGYSDSDIEAMGEFFSR